MNNENYYILTSDGELYHYGIKGMKWGVRRYQNADGSLTPKGKKRLAKNEALRNKLVNKADKRIKNHTDKAKEAKANIRDLKKHGKNSEVYKRWKEAEDAKREFEYENENKIVGPDGNTYVKKYSTSGSRFANDLFDSVFSDTTVLKLIDENRNNANFHTERAEKWTNSKSNLMNMNIDELTKKSAIRTTYWMS